MAPATECRPIEGSCQSLLSPPDPSVSLTHDEPVVEREADEPARRRRSQRSRRSCLRRQTGHLRQVPANPAAATQDLRCVRDLYGSREFLSAHKLRRGSSPETAHVADFGMCQTEAPEDERGIVGRESDDDGSDGRTGVAEHSAREGERRVSICPKSRSAFRPPDVDALEGVRKREDGEDDTVGAQCQLEPACGTGAVRAKWAGNALFGQQERCGFPPCSPA